MPQNQQMRDLVAQMKLIPVESQVKGKRILFCDDSIVRGTQMRETVAQLLELGAAEVHMCSASPPLLFGCKYLNFSRSRSELDLAARRAIQHLEHGAELTPEILEKYFNVYGEPYRQMVEEVRRELNLSTLHYQTLEGLLAAIGLPEDKVCTYCWNGRE
ncbi:Amidophosphoribosyltransferase [bioreactor metagenome]|uniref:Amidophosphoribosyltransferase n=1 Tax=bioreactor metagenome TaxID=1076179 RepID=A0A645C543_9ZZZZ